MATREEVYQAILNADKAGDSESVRTLGAYLQTMSQGFQPTLPEPKQSAFRQVADVPLGIAKGAAQGVRMLSDVFGAGSGTSTAIKGVENYITELMSAQSRQDQQEMSRIQKEAEDKGVWEQVKAAARAASVAPIDTLSSVLGTAIPAIAAGVGAATFGAPAALATGAGALISAGMSAGTIKGSIYDATKNALVEAGASPQDAEQKAQLAQSYGGQNLDQILLGTVIGGVAGAGPLERGAASLLSRHILGKAAVAEAGETAAKGALRQRAEAGVLEALPEALQAGQEQVAQNIAQQREGMDVPTFRGAVGAATLEGLAGAGLGAAVGGGRAAPVETLPPVEAPVAEAPVAPIAPEAQVQPRVDDITGVSRETPPSAEGAAETFARMYSMGDEEGRAYAERVTQDRILRQQQAIDADAERVAELNRQQGITYPETPVSPIEERPSIAEAPPELTLREDLLAKQAEIDQRRLEAGLPTGQASLTPGVEPTAPIVEEPQPVPKIVDNRPLTEKAAANRLLVMRNMLKNQGGDPNSLTVVPNPSAPTKFAIQSLDVPVKFQKNLPATAIDRPVTPTIIDPVNAYVEVQRRTNTPAARRFVSDFEAGNITREDVQSAISVERKAAEPPLAVLPKGEIVSAPTSKTRAEPTSFQIELKQKAEANGPFAIAKFEQDGRNVYYASPAPTLEANQRTELALTQQEQKEADASQAGLDVATTQDQRIFWEEALQSVLRRATVRALSDVKVPQILPPKPTVTEEVSPPPTSIDTTQPVALPKSLDEFKDRLPSVWDKADVRKANEAGDFKQLVASLQAGSNPVIRRIGEMAQGLGNKIRLDKPGKLKKSTWAGQFSWGPSGESIKLRPDYAGNEEVNAHEMVHALTISVQRNPVTDKQRQYVAKIKDLYQHVKREFNKKGITAYGLQDEFEFTAEAMTNPKFQYELMQLPYPGKKNAWSQFVQTVADLLGITNTNALTEIMTLVEKVSQTKAPRKKVTGVYTIGSEIEGAPRKSLVAQRSKLGLYSELENKIQAGSPKAPAASWKAYINGLTQKGVKPEEIEWSGVRDWLDLQKGPVLKEDLLNYLKEGGVQVEETVLGAQGFTQAMQNRLDELDNNNDRTDAEDAERQRLISAENAASDVRGEVNQTKFGKYTLSGGENYREVLLTLPYQKGVVAPEIERIVSQLPNGVVSALPAESIDSFADSIASQYGVNNLQMRDGIRAARGAPAPNVALEYRSSHWKQPNVLAHIRLNDRIDADGKKVLFVEEIQSDWGQEGTQVRKKEVKRLMAQGMSKEEANQAVPQDFGFAGKPLAYTLKKSGSGWTINWENGRFDFVPGSEEDARREADAAASRIGKVPAAPFVTKTEGWLNLALKRIMVMAAEEGYDRVAFATGEQNAERFSLDKQLSEIAYEPTGDGLYEITATDLKGKEVISEDEVGLDRIEELLGKEIAEKIARNEGEQDEGGYRDWRYLRGNNLKVEAKGMRTFYDTIVPTALKKLLPKVGGTQLQPVEIYKQGIVGKKLPADAKPAAMRDGRLFTQPGFDVTPEMQEKVATTGLPMFSKKGERTQQLQDFQQTLRAQLNKFGLTDVGLKIEAGMKNAGSYAQQLIRIANDSAKPIQTLRHEAIHALRQLGFFTDSQWKSLSKMAEDKWIDQYLKQRNVNGKPLKAGEESRYDAYVREYKGDMEKITEEAVSDAFGDFDATKPPAGLIQAILKRLQNLFQSIQSALTKVESPEQIFGKVEKGELKAGSREADQQTPNFLKWFGDSKVVDEKGKPLVVYHGTGSDFSSFDVKKIATATDGGVLGKGFYFTTNAALADSYAAQSASFGKSGATVLPVYLSIKNPFFAGGGSAPMEAMRKIAGNRPANMTSPEGDAWGKKLREGLIALGYDGVMDTDSRSGAIYANEIVAFYPEQIKSAIGNNGDYSLTNSDISKSLRGAIKEATDNFKKWFKNSKVKDDDGKPKVMYHATPEDFTEFKPGGKDETISGPAIWLSPYADTQAAAHNIGRKKGQPREGTNVMPVYVRMERPLVIDDMTSLEFARSAYGNSEFPQLISKKAVADMKEDGYDGIQFDGEALGWGDRSNETIVFDANQIKSAIGNNGEYSLTEADIRKSLGGTKAAKPTIGEKLRAAGQEAYQKRKPLDTGAFSHVAADFVSELNTIFAPRNETVLDRIDGMKDNFWQRVAQGVADQYRSIKEYSEDAYMKARMSKTIDGALEGIMFHGQVFNDGGALNIRKSTKGMLEVLKPVGKELDNYLIWVALGRESTMPSDKRSIPDKVVSRRAELIQGSIDGQSRLEVYQKVQKEMNALNRSVLKVAVDAGLLNTTEGAIRDIKANDKLTDQEKAEKIAELRANPIGYERFINDLNYIPFYKVMEKGDTQNVSTASGLTSQYFSKALKGGEKPFGDLMENTLRNWSHILSASMKNQAASATLDAAVKHNAATPNLKDGLEMRGNKVYSIKSDEMVGDGSLRPEFTKNDTGAVKVMMDGQPTYYMVTDPLLLDAISAISYMGPKSKFLDVARDFKNLLQYGVTIAPTFKVNNVIRDSVSAMAVSELRKDPVSNVMQGISLSDKNSETYIAGLAGGAIFNFGSAYEGDQSRLLKRLLKQGVSRDSILDTKQRIAKGLRDSFDKYQEWGNKSESANRLAL